MLVVRTRRPVAPDDIRALRAVADRAEAADGHPSLGESVWQSLADTQTGHDTLLLAADDDETVGAVHLTAEPGGPAVAAITVDPGHREAGVATELAEAAAREAAVLGCAHLVLWAFGVDDRADAFATAAGFAPERELWQMRAALPLTVSIPWPNAVELRAFEPGRDDAEWLEVNNRAFADDPDQREWTTVELERRTREPWFDPAGFLLAVEDGRITGFCWTKVHPAAPPHEPEPMGEIYVIGVDPSRQGTGLGRALVAAGLGSLHDRGIDIGMLFVDATNRPAISLYESMGFAATRRDRAYGRDVP